MTDQSSPPAVAHGEPLVVVAPEGVADAISRVMARHQDELDAALEPFDVSLDDLVQATWMRFVRVGDVEALRSPGGWVAPSEALIAAAVDDGPVPEVEMVRSPRGGCCGSGDACSGCGAAAPREVFPEPRQDAAVFGAPAAARFGRGGVRGDDE